jgi:trimeric autotransporter adhesin
VVSEHYMKLESCQSDCVMPSHLLWRLAVFVLPLLLLTSCSGEFFRGSNDIVSITISPLNTAIQPANTQKFTATGTFGTGGVGDVTSQATWTSSDSSIATIDSTGLATGVADGTVTIGGAYQGYTAKTSLSVGSQTAAISSIAVTPVNPTIAIGLTQQFVATATDPNGTHSVITNSAKWTSSDDAIATVSLAGLATGLSPGNGTMAAISGSVTGSATSTVQ